MLDKVSNYFNNNNNNNNCEYINNFKKQSFEERSKQSSSVIIKYPDRVPVIVDTNNNSNFNEQLDKHKFVVPDTLSVSEFIIIIRKRLKIDPTKGIFIFCNNSILIGTYSMRSIYDQYKENDGFLYLIYAAESTFGN